MTTTQHHQLAELVGETIEQLGSQGRAAVRLGINSSYVSHIVNGKFAEVSDAVWRRIATALSYRKRNWVTVSTFNTRAVEQALNDAKQRSLMIAISHPAGGGKTSGAELYARQHRREQVYLVKCREWRRRQFLMEVCQILGIQTNKKKATYDDLIVLVTEFFLDRADHRPLLIIDEADKLLSESLRCLIPLYNETEGELGIVLLGTENLKRQITNGVQYDKKGYDEIESRIGRHYVELYGASKKDFQAICNANEVTDKATQNQIWESLKPSEVKVGNAIVKMVKDMRAMKRAVQCAQLDLEESRNN